MAYTTKPPTRESGSGGEGSGGRFSPHECVIFKGNRYRAFFNPGNEERAPSRRSHYSPGMKRSFHCRECSEIDWKGSACRYISAATQRLMQQTKNGAPVFSSEFEARKKATGQETFLLNMFIGKYNEKNEPVIIGQRYVAVPFKVANELIPMKERELSFKCICNKGELRYKGYKCPECGEDIGWAPPDKEKGIFPVCSSCKTKLTSAPDAVVECSARCAEPRPGTIMDCPWIITRGENGYWDFSPQPFQPRPDAVKRATPLDLAAIIANEWTSQDAILAAFGYDNAGSAPVEHESGGFGGSSDTFSGSEDSVPF